MRIGIISLLHESNTFVEPTTIRNFKQDILLEGEAIRDVFGDSHHEIGGFFARLHQADLACATRVEAVPIFAARALPSGTLTTATFNELRHTMFAALQRAGRLDGLLVAPHGATVSEDHPDADGVWLSELRDRVGPQLPIVGTIDAHANLSALMVASCDALVAYRTNPHLDQRDRGIEAADLLLRTVVGEVRPTMSATFPPLAINIERQHTNEPHLAQLYRSAERQLGRPKMLSNSIVLGFPYADVAEMGSSVVAVTDDNQALATTAARELAAQMWEQRYDFVGELVDVEEALDRCRTLEGPVCLLDMGDNVGGGATADGTIVARSLHEHRIEDAFVCIADPESVNKAARAGSGNEIELQIGGKTDSRHGAPLTVLAAVQSLHDGVFFESNVRHGGFRQFDQGRTAVVTTDYGLTIMLTSRRMVPFTLQQLRSCGLDPMAFKILVAKGVNAPVPAYREVCQHFIRVNTPGSTCADMTKLEFRHRRQPMFPIELDTPWVVS